MASLATYGVCAGWSPAVNLWWKSFGRCLLQFWHLQLSHSSWINKSQHCHNGALLTPTHKHTYTKTNRCLVMQADSGTDTDTLTDSSQMRTFLTHEWDSRLLPRLCALLNSSRVTQFCYLSVAVHFTDTALREVLTSRSAIQISVSLYDPPSYTGLTQKMNF